MNQPPSVDTRTPVSLLTGFLGSGKTTLLNAWPLEQFVIPQVANIVLATQELMLKKLPLLAAL